MDLETFLITLYVTVDDFAKSQLPAEEVHPGPSPSLCRSEVVTLSVLAQWGRFPSELSFYRFADKHLRSAFPSLPHCSQFNRLARAQRDATTAFALYLSVLLEADRTPYQAADGMGVRVRNCKRRGRGWMAGMADIGWSNRLGWYEGFNVFLANTAEGVITGFGFGPASTNDRRMAETLFAARQKPVEQLPNAGAPATQPYVLDKGFGGRVWQRRWREEYDAHTICVPERNCSHPWPKALRRWHAGLRQIAETVHEKLLGVFRLDRERPHALSGFQIRLAANVALHNFCMWLNQQLGRPLLAFADLISW